MRHESQLRTQKKQIMENNVSNISVAQDEYIIEKPVKEVTPRPVSQAEMLNMDGYTLMRGMMDGILPPPPIAHVLDFYVCRIARGECDFKGKAKADFCNPFGTVHGGFLATLLDSAMTCSAQTILPPATACTTVEMKINFVRGVPGDGRVLYAKAKIIHGGRKLMTSDARLEDEQGKLYAHSTTTVMALPLKQE